MAYSYKTSIGFGLVYIPITLHSTIKNNDIGFNMLERKTLSRVKYNKTCTDCNNKIIKNEDIIKGYEISKDNYVTFENEELEKLKTKKDKSVIIEKFASLDEINPIYFDKTFYVCPENKQAEKAFSLLKTVLKKEKKVGISKTMLGNSECIAILWVKNDDLLLSKLFFAEEVQTNPASNLKIKVDEKELKLAQNIIDVMKGKFTPEDYKDEYTQRVKEAINAKAKGKEIEQVDQEVDIKVVDLLEALQKSVKTFAKKRAVKET